MKQKYLGLQIVLFALVLLGLYVQSLDCVLTADRQWGVALSCRDNTAEKYHQVIAWNW